MKQEKEDDNLYAAGTFPLNIVFGKYFASCLILLVELMRLTDIFLYSPYALLHVIVLYLCVLKQCYISFSFSLGGGVLVNCKVRP